MLVPGQTYSFYMTHCPTSPATYRVLELLGLVSLIFIASKISSSSWGIYAGSTKLKVSRGWAAVIQGRGKPVLWWKAVNVFYQQWPRQVAGKIIRMQYGFVNSTSLSTRRKHWDPIHRPTEAHIPQMDTFISLSKEQERMKDEASNYFTWVAAGMFTVPLQLPTPAREFPAVSCPWDSKQFTPCLMIPGINSFSGILRDQK